MILMRGNIIVISMVAIFCAFPSKAEVSHEDIDTWRADKEKEVADKVYEIA